MPGSDLLFLNDDVLRSLLELLLHAGGLNELSQTSRQVRAACMPILFRQCFRPMQVRLPEPQMFLPYSLWPHVQILVIRDDCFEKHYYDTLRFTDNCLLCGVLSGSLVERWLQRMPRLRSVTLYHREEELHGMPWSTLRAVLSLPQIREFKLHQLHFCPALRPSDELRMDSVASLTSFEYLLRKPAESYIAEPRFTNDANYSDERRALSTALGALQKTLEVLSLPTESVPMKVFSQHPWPHLRRLVIRGKPSEDLVSSVLSSVSPIPALKSLVLKFSATRTTRPGALWRGDSMAVFPCPALEELAITYPDPADQLFDHLPLTLHTLSLCCWRHLYHEFLTPYRSWVPSDGPRFSLLLSSSQMRGILNRSRTPGLVQLTLEYRADDREEELLHHVAQAYPRLTYLKLIRFRPRGVDTVQVERMAQALSPLAHIHELKIHLDLPEMPLPGAFMMRSASGGYSLSAMERFRPIVDETVNVFARELSSSVKFISMITPTASCSTWARFRVVDGRAQQQEE
ncbi:hypothetical protein K466DRAFT_59697 [Polyporus arcularius HHB13444]|uniref:F-box domain-containing protein n=1 Tax=Polyporus arcularius HHB13444 TaxID=1314778 RepID=A0A5C3PVG6_9APHY|nr:hypothetical protein K466DRAFT_59697 [Polyporus arcularius HHB13444]